VKKKIPGTGIFVQKKNPGTRNFHQKTNKNPGTRDFHQKKKNPGYQDLQGKFFGRYAPDQNTELHPNGGGADGILGEGSLLYSKV
jgi:hypothetical protein